MANPNLIPNKKPEVKVKARYTAGFQDIMNKHFLDQLQGPSVEKVIAIVSHSDGVEAWLDLFAPGESSNFADYNYCCTFAVELVAKLGTNGEVSVERQRLNVIHN